ncbi:hypothetical protein TIFTF001_028538 [Ficus carica]|uniref:Uncharacterized protein n=1 Tax=Ficus carica TaxID=3494 RepID=A0AA88DQ61_FICCA|nr:hypothetical protein TIFTF001_028538 [Ficus carica]
MPSSFIPHESSHLSYPPAATPPLILSRASPSPSRLYSPPQLLPPISSSKPILC